MIYLRELQTTQPSELPHRHRARKKFGGILWKIAKTRPGLLFAIASLAVIGMAWAFVKLAFASGGGYVLALLRDAGHAAGDGSLPGAAGGAAAGGTSGGDKGPANSGYQHLPPLEPGQYRSFSDDGIVYTYTPNPNSPSGVRIVGFGPSNTTWWDNFVAHLPSTPLPAGGSIAAGKFAVMNDAGTRAHPGYYPQGRR